ncbi:MAG: hydroxymethylbilane synthase [Sedimentisphaerales bacterium]|nr:hydroxymethylbilane synthase [Sedimentisphaerales bacterium]
MRPVKIATRASKLALAQSNYIGTELRKLDPDIEIKILEISTKGDRDKSDFLYKGSAVGYFTSEVERALLEKRADLAVHSFKDLPTACTEGLAVAAVPARESVADALITAKPVVSLAEMPPASIVGTSSLRRIAQVKLLRNDLKCVPLRGNVETRLAKVAGGEVDAAIVACAGLNRLGLADKISAVLPPEQFLPAPAQGALAVQIREDDTELASLVSKLDDPAARLTAETERRILASMHGGCSIPLGVYARVNAGNIIIDALISDIEGKTHIRRSAAAAIEKAVESAEKLARELLDAGGRQILEKVRADRAN